MNYKPIVVIGSIFIVLLIVISIVTAKIDESAELQKNKERTMQREMFKLGASMYRSQVVNTYGDSIIFPVDSLFIREVLDYNDTLGREIEASTLDN